MSDSEMARRLRAISHVETLGMGVRNDILDVGATFVVVQSERTENPRTIWFSEVRNAERATKNGCVVRTLAAILGI